MGRLPEQAFRVLRLGYYYRSGQREIPFNGEAASRCPVWGSGCTAWLDGNPGQRTAASLL